MKKNKEIVVNKTEAIEVVFSFDTTRINVSVSYASEAQSQNNN